MTDARPMDTVRTTRLRAVPPAEDVANRRQLLAALQRIAVHLETADVLDLRAERSPSPSLAVVLRERAAVRRRTAGRLRADLAARGVLAYRPRRPAG